MVSDDFRRLRYELRTRLACHEWPYLWLGSLKGGTDIRGQTVVGSHTEFVVEAFPRSGNTFAVEAFMRGQPRAVRMAHHMHAPAQILRARRLGIPALAIVREPQDAVLSFVIKEPVVPVRQALRAWLMFYETLTVRPTGFVLATFDQITADFGAVTRRVNAAFGTRFGCFEHSPENVEACFAAIDGRYANRFGSGTVHEDQVSRPSNQRAALKAELRDKYLNLDSLAATADALYAHCVDLAAAVDPTTEDAAAPDTPSEPISLRHPTGI